MENLSPHITCREATFSDTAIRYHLLNEPTEEQLTNMKRIAWAVFEPLRAFLGNRPLHISSFFRSRELNIRIGGNSTRSQHMANYNAAAMDIDNDDTLDGPTNLMIFNVIRERLVFDQPIKEFPDADGNPSWVHVSYSLNGNRNEVLECRFVDGRRQYFNL